MSSSAAAAPSRSFVPTALMLGNLVVGTSVVAPAGMLNELAADMHIGIGQASLLLTLGAVVLCLGSPLLSWATSRMDRRQLLAISLAIIAVAHVAAALVSSFTAVLVLRLVMLAAAAPFTPQAAGVVGLVTTPAKRAGAISYVFLGWSLAAAAGLPLMTAIASRVGWQYAFGAIAVMALVALALLLWRLPAGLHTPAVDLKTWGTLFRNPAVLLLLLLTVLQMSGQFTIFTLIGPLLVRLTEATPNAIAVAFAAYGVGGFIGNLVASQIVGRIGAFRTSLIFTLIVTLGITTWAVGSGVYPVMVAGIALWGLGFAAANSMQQARLAGAVPRLAGSAVALNTSALYVGQAIGSAVGSVLFVNGHHVASGYVAVAVMVLAIGVLLTTRD